MKVLTQSDYFELNRSKLMTSSSTHPRAKQCYVTYNAKHLVISLQSFQYYIIELADDRLLN